MLSNIFDAVFSLEFVITVIRLATPILFASSAAFIASVTGIGNIAIEGTMTMSALFGVLGSYLFKNAFMGLLLGVLTGVVISLGIAFFSMKLGASAILVEIALNTFADSLAIFILYQVAGEKGTSASLATSTLGTLTIPFIKDIPVIGRLLSGHYILTYVGIISLIILYIFIYKTPIGMRMRACGLNSEASESVGINVKKLQVISLVLSGILAALGGIYLSLNYLKIFSKNMVAGQGWMGIAANGVANGSFKGLIISSVIFSIFRGVSITFGTSSQFPTDLVAAVPYFAVLIGITAVSIYEYYKRKKGLAKSDEKDSY